MLQQQQNMSAISVIPPPTPSPICIISHLHVFLNSLSILFVLLLSNNFYVRPYITLLVNPLIFLCEQKIESSCRQDQEQMLLLSSASVNAISFHGKTSFISLQSSLGHWYGRIPGTKSAECLPCKPGDRIRIPGIVLYLDLSFLLL